MTRQPMTRKEMVTRALESLGLDATQKQTEQWLQKEYGVKVVDSVFYTTRKELREKAASFKPDVLPRGCRFDSA